MAAVVLTAVTIIGTGVAPNASTATTAGTITITVDDMSRGFVRAQNNSTTASVILSIGAGTSPHVAAGIGAQSVTLGTAETKYIGASWDSARFKTTAGTVLFTIPTGGRITLDYGVLTKY